MNVEIKKRPNQRCHPLSFVSEGVETDGSENPHGPATVIILNSSSLIPEDLARNT